MKKNFKDPSLNAAYEVLSKNCESVTIKETAKGGVIDAKGCKVDAEQIAKEMAAADKRR
jgi:hypothetical protein